jgi:hypothetical protein
MYRGFPDYMFNSISSQLKIYLPENVEKRIDMLMKNL